VSGFWEMSWLSATSAKVSLTCWRTSGLSAQTSICRSDGV
jgi:hypothetical protein